jgi:UDP-N-acetylmuramate dehydrogenase
VSGKIAEVSGAKLRDFTTVGIGGGADRMVFPNSAREVQEVVKAERTAGREVRTLGAGSNLLVSDTGVRGTVVCLKRNMGRILFAGGGTVVADAGTMLPRFAVLCALSGLSGAEELAGIPGTVGGALVMNAGAYGRRIGEIVNWVEIVDADGDLHRFAAREIRFVYRHVFFPADGIIVRAGFRFRAGSPDAAFALMKTVNEKRRANQPWGERTFGSTFRNPEEGERAGRLLERAGMKGAREGDAVFSDKHANFVVNLGRARANDVLRLMRRGQEAVREISGTMLVPEVRMWGVFDE